MPVLEIANMRWPSAAWDIRTKLGQLMEPHMTWPASKSILKPCYDPIIQNWVIAFIKQQPTTWTYLSWHFLNRRWLIVFKTNHSFSPLVYRFSSYETCESFSIHIPSYHQDRGCHCTARSNEIWNQKKWWPPTCQPPWPLAVAGVPQPRCCQPRPTRLLDSNRNPSWQPSMVVSGVSGGRVPN